MHRHKKRIRAFLPNSIFMPDATSIAVQQGGVYANAIRRVDEQKQRQMKRTLRRWIWFGGAAAVVLALLIAARLYLNVWLLDYVNRVLSNIQGYQGSVQSLDIDLYRGAYRIHTLKVVKKTGQIPVPFIDVETVDLSIQWGALFRGRIVSDAELIRPVLNYLAKPPAMLGD